ncbi:MAG: dockerin type I repeat-containing protein, partial [Planctomycetota bacterium]
VIEAAVSEEVIWRAEPIAVSAAIIPDNVAQTLGPGTPASARYCLAQVIVMCNPGQPRVGLPGQINRIVTFFENETPVEFEFLPDAQLNSETGQFEIPGLARLNIYEVSSPNNLPSPNDDPDFGINLKAVFSQNVNRSRIEVRVEDLITQLPTPFNVQPGVVYYIGLTPIFESASDAPFSGIHLTNPDPVGGEQQSAYRETQPDPTDWIFAGNLFSDGKPQYATIQINGPPAFYLGDTNGDGVVNLLDVQPFVQFLSSGQYQKEADLDGDGFVNLLDVGPFVDLLSGNP